MSLKSKQDQVKVYFGNIKAYMKEVEEELNSFATYSDLETIEVKIDRMIENIENAKQVVMMAYDELEE